MKRKKLNRKISQISENTIKINERNTYEIVSTLNHLMIAYFVYEAEKIGVDFYSARPVADITRGMVGRTFVNGIDYAFKRDFFSYRIVIHNVSLKVLMLVGIERWINSSISDEIKKAAQDFSELIIKYPYSDFIFSMLPEEYPFISDSCLDSDTGVASRLIYGIDFYSTQSFIFDIQCLIIDRMRLVKKEGDVPNLVFQKVEFMTPEERELYDKQPEVKE